MYFSVLKDQEKYTACQDVHLKKLNLYPLTVDNMFELGFNLMAEFQSMKKEILLFLL